MKGLDMIRKILNTIAYEIGYIYGLFRAIIKLIKDALHSN